jgi:formylglycine-generating enzyme required for sulfatase activity
MILVLLTGLSRAAPQVSNVKFAQQTGNNQVEITYDLYSTSRDTLMTVSFDVSTDGGKTFAVKPKSWTGDAGPEVRAGTGHKIIWNMYADAGRFHSDSAVVRVVADDGRRPGMNPELTGDEQRRATNARQSGLKGLVYLATNAQGYEEYTCTQDSSTMIRIPEAEFWIGSPPEEGDVDEHPEHDVRLDEFYLDKFEVTNREYRRFCDSASHEYPLDPDFPDMDDYFRNYPDYPVVNVSWDDAMAYAAWAGKDLPTEAEWEAAARGPNARKYPWGFTEPDGRRANFADRNTDYPWSEKAYDDGYARTAPDGTYPDGASFYGAMDMAGNVWEWCRDWYGSSYYRGSPDYEPRGPRSGVGRVIKGGGWNYGFKQLRCAGRQAVSPGSHAAYLGFRCVKRR